jgi:hypothetical protein
MDLVEMGLGGLDWIGLAQDRYNWRAFVNAVMKPRVLQNAGKLPSCCQLVASRVVLSSTELIGKFMCSTSVLCLERLSNNETTLDMDRFMYHKTSNGLHRTPCP